MAVMLVLKRLRQRIMGFRPTWVQSEKYPVFKKKKTDREDKKISHTHIY